MNHGRRALGLAIVIAISDLIAEFLVPKIGLGAFLWSPPLLAAVIAVALLSFLRKYGPFRLIKPLRRWLFGEVSAYEGFWISEVSHEQRPFSISKIFYSKSRACWMSAGYAFSRDYKLVASWVGQSIHFDPESNYWFFKGNWWRHPDHSEHRSAPPMDQFFKYQTNYGQPNKLAGVIIDNTEMAGKKKLRQRERTEVLVSSVRRITREDFRKIVRIRPKRIEEISTLTPADVKRLIEEFARLHREPDEEN